MVTSSPHSMRYSSHVYTLGCPSMPPRCMCVAKIKPCPGAAGIVRYRYRYRYKRGMSSLIYALLALSLTGKLVLISYTASVPLNHPCSFTARTQSAWLDGLYHLLLMYISACLQLIEIREHFLYFVHWSCLHPQGAGLNYKLLQFEAD